MASATVLDQLETINSFRERAPVDIFGLIRALGVEFSEAFLEPEISGMIERAGKDRYRIAVNYNDPDTRQRFTAAHELGHYMLHRDKIGDGVDDDRLYRSTPKGKYYNTAIGRTQETEANKFAANVLMPIDLVTEKLGGRIADRSLAQSLARDFQVSEQAMCIRLGINYDNA